MNFIAIQSVDDTTPCILQQTGPSNIVFFIKTCFQFHQYQHFFSVLCGFDQGFHDFTLFCHTVQCHLNRNNIFIVGCLLGIAGLVLLIVFAALRGGGPAHMAAAIVYGVSIILEYLASTLYHAIQPAGAKRVFRIIDHSCIYLLIAGSYTPFCLITLANDGGAVLFFAVWAIAIIGIALECFMRERQPHWVSGLVYLLMGWLVVFKLPELVALLSPVALALLAVGGACYTAGVPFYIAKNVRYLHSVFHLWVLAGSIFQFMAVILFVI